MSFRLVYIQHVETGEMHAAQLYDYISEDHLDLWEKEWLPVMNGYTSGRPHPGTPEDAHWDWVQKSKNYHQIMAISSYALICNSTLQGMMMTDNTRSGRVPEQFGKPLVYIQYLATSPENRPEVKSKPDYRGTGRVLILEAILASKKLGYKGRIALHSLPKAEDFYENKCKLTKLGADASCDDMTYFEMTETQAEQFCRNE